MSSLDAQQYAEALRRSLMEDLFDGQDISADDTDGTLSGLADPDSVAAEQLRDLDKDLELFSNHEVIRSVLDQGRVVKEFARDIDEKLRAAELESIQDYIAESDNLVALHDQIQSCDVILARMEQLLGSFQSDLGTVSDEIRQLQVQSQAMSTKLRNRRMAEDRLGAFVEAVAVPEELVAGIVDSEVCEEYQEHLLALDKRLNFIDHDATAAGSAAKRDVSPVLERLRIKAVTKLREFLLGKLYSLRKPKTNVSIIQTNVLLKFKYFVRFLRVHGVDVLLELRAEYISVLSKVYAHHFRTYLSALDKMGDRGAGQGDVLGAAEGGGGGGGSGLAAVGGAAGVVIGNMGNSVMSMFGAKAAGRALTEQAFVLGDRVAVLHEPDKPPLIPHMAEFEGKRFPYEVIFRNVHKLLVDTASAEFLFCLDFWGDEAAFRELWGPVVALVEGDLGAVLPDIWDCVAVLLMIRLNADHRALMRRRRVPCLDDYFDRLDLLLWPRFKVLFDLQAGSIRPGAERSLFSGEPGVHYVTRRYAALSASILALMADHDSEDGVFHSSSFHEQLERLWAAMFDLLLRMSNMFKDRRLGIVFLILNYNHIKATLRAADSRLTSPGSGGGAADRSPSSPTSLGGGLGLGGAAAMKDCESQLASCMSLYVEDQLASHFKGLVEHVKKAEQAQKRLAVPEGQPVPGYGPNEAAPVLRDFSIRWTGAIEAMHKEVARQFADSTCGREVLQASMTQLLLYYTRLLELLKRQGPAGSALVKEAVNIPAIMYEIKRITKA